MPLRTREIAGLSALVLALGACTAQAENRQANPDNINSVLARANSGDTIVLSPGSYEQVKLSGKSFDPPVLIDARAATFDGVLFDDVKGVVLRGGTFQLPPPTPKAATGDLVYGATLRMNRIENVKVIGATFAGPGRNNGGEDDPYGEGYGVFVVKGAKVEVSDNHFTGFKSGVVLSRAEDFNLLRNTFAAMRSDGMQVAESHHGLIEGNECGQTRIRDKEHPDCIQMWSRPTSPPTSDVTIRGNKIRGDTQGIGLFNHVRQGVDDGGFDRIVIEDNDIEVSFPHGIGIFAARDSIVRNNKVRTFGHGRWHATINSSDIVARCSNTVAPSLGKPGLSDPPCPKQR